MKGVVWISELSRLRPTGAETTFPISILKLWLYDLYELWHWMKTWFQQCSNLLVYRCLRLKVDSLDSDDDIMLTLRRPLRKKLRMKWFFDVSKVKESSFFKSDLTDSPQIFDAHLLENTNLSPSRFHFSVGFLSRSYFRSDGFIAYSSEWDRREKKRC